MPIYVLDTNIIAELFKAKPAQEVVDFVGQVERSYLSVVVFSELLFGIEKDKDKVRKARLIAYVNGLRMRYKRSIIPIDLEVAEIAGQLRAFEANKGRVLSPMDSFIAATTLVLGATLVTRNTKDFKNLNLELLNPFPS